MRRSTSLQGCSSASPAFGFDAVPGSLYPPPAAMSSLLCAPGVISILRRHGPKGLGPLIRRGLPNSTKYLCIRPTGHSSEAIIARPPSTPRQLPGDHPEQNMSAREAAEAPVTPKPDVIEQPLSDPTNSAKPRKPRGLSILPPA